MVSKVFAGVNLTRVRFNCFDFPFFFFLQRFVTACVSYVLRAGVQTAVSPSYCTSSLFRGALNRYSFVSCALAEWDWYGRNIAGDDGGGVSGIETGGFEVNGGIYIIAISIGYGCGESL